MTSNTSIKYQINWNLWIPGILFVFFVIIEKKSFGTFYTSWLYGLILILVGIMYSIRFKLYQPLLAFSLGGLTLWHYWLAEYFDTNIYMLQLMGIDISISSNDSPFSMIVWIINLIILFSFMPFVMPVMEKAIKLELSARRIFKTAAQTVYSTTNGFTPRPYSAGQSRIYKRTNNRLYELFIRKKISFSGLQRKGYLSYFFYAKKSVVNS